MAQVSNLLLQKNKLKNEKINQNKLFSYLRKTKKVSNLKS